MDWRNTKQGSNKLLSLHRQSPTPFSSDEGAESGDDSEEDLVTNYIPPSSPSTDTSAPSPRKFHPTLQYAVQPVHLHGPPRRLLRMAEIPTMDSMTAEALSGSEAYIPPIPTISITPHSPITHKPFPVLDENIKQIHGLQETIQRMRDTNLAVKNKGNLARLSSSCPSLNMDEDGDDDDTPSCSEEFLLDNRNVRVASPSDVNRRKSWSGLSDEDKKRARRSISLSSLDSDGEEAFGEPEPTVSTQAQESSDLSIRQKDKQRSLSGSCSPAVYDSRAGSSTHSLNDVHLQQKVEPPATTTVRLLEPRFILQKSISTPSILAGVLNQQAQQHSQPSNYQYEDDSSNKRRKKASLFFRNKRKDKEDKKKKSSHQFYSVCYSNSATCDVCNKPMANKSALRCEICQVCVHENSCKDQITDCSKLKNPKVIQKPGTILTTSGPSSRSSSISGISTVSLGISSTGSSKSTSTGTIRGRSNTTHSSSPTRPQNISAPSSKGGADEKDHDHPHDTHDPNIMEVNSASMESLDDAPEESNIEDLDADPELLLFEEEPETWAQSVTKEVISTLTEKQVKRQEAIYEVIRTEKTHCKMLHFLQKVFAEGMAKELQMPESHIDRIFPCLNRLKTIHCTFLWRLRQLQRANRYIESIAPLLYDQFTGDNAQELKEAYGFISSQQPDSASFYKDILKTDRKFQNFIRQRSQNPLMKKNDITAHIMFIMQRATKYPLMLDSIIKYTIDNPQEQTTLRETLRRAKEIVVNINEQVNEKEVKKRLLEIYHKIDAKSSIPFKEYKIKKSDLLNNNRKLKFEGTATLTQQKGKPILVHIIVMSDFVFFLHENNQKYNFVISDNKAGAIPLDKLIARRKAGEGSHTIYILHEKYVAEMFEFECHHPKEVKVWLQSIQEAKDQYLEEKKHDPSGNSTGLTEQDSKKIRELLDQIQQRDLDAARIYEDKSIAMSDLLDCLGHEETINNPDYVSMLEENNLSFSEAKELQINSLQEAIRLVSSASGLGTNLARSVSSVGEHQSEAYVSPSLPKRAETFGGFDNSNKDNPGGKQSVGKKKKDSRLSLASASTTDGNDLPDSIKNRRPSGSSSIHKSSQDNLNIMSTETFLSPQGQINVPSSQQVTCTKLLNCLQTALVLSQHHLTQHEWLRTKALTGSAGDGRLGHSQKLEELRNMQVQISHERAQWTKEREAQESWITEKKVELRRLDEQLREQQKDILQQRDDLYRKLETLQNQGISLSPGMTVIYPPPQPQHEDNTSASVDSTVQSSPHNSPTCTVPPTRTQNKHRSSNVSLAMAKRDSNPSLLSQHKQTAPIKQQLPMKLAKLGTASSSSSSSSISSSLTSSMSTGGSMSPSQDQLPTQKNQSGTVQMLPLKLSENLSESRKVVMGYQGYQRLTSPTTVDQPAHQRTGSSPASLQNGSPTSQGTVTTTSPVSQHNPKATRTNTYPKISSKPSVAATRTSSEASRSRDQPSIDLTANTKPGQRIKDPESNQDIIFF